MKNIIAAIECASAGPTEPGGFDVRLMRAGWKFIIEQFAPAYQAGVRTLMLHRPNGESGQGGIMNLDARVDLMDNPNAKRLINMQPRFLDQFHNVFPDARLIAYLGSSQEPDWAERSKRQDFAALWDRYGRSLKPWFDCPFCDLAFDHAGQMDGDNPHGAMIVAVEKLLGLAGRTVYVEPQPKPWSVTGHMPSIMLERWWRRYADKDRPVIRWFNGHELNAEDSPWGGDVWQWFKDCISTNCTPMVNVGELRQLLEVA